MGQEGGTEPLNESLISTLGQAADQHKDALKYSSLLVFLLSTTADTVLARKVSYAAFFPASLAVLTAIAGSVIFPAIVLGQCVISWRRTGESPWKNVFPAYGMRTCEKPYKDILKVILTAPLIGFLFGAHHLLTNTGAGHGPSALPGTLILVLGKLTVPISMLLNMRLLFGGKIYNWRHSCALGFLFIGIICTVWSPLMGASYNIQMAKNMVLVALGALPLAIAFAIIEKSLKGELKDLFTPALWMWICLSQSLLTPCLAFIARNFGVVQHHHAPSVVSVQDGMMCYVWGSLPRNAPDLTDCSQASSWWWWAAVFGLCMNLAMPISTRYGGATIMWFVRAMATPICSVIFSSTFIMGQHAIPYSFPQNLGIILVTAALVIFEYAEDPDTWHGFLEKYGIKCPPLCAWSSPTK